MLEEKVKKLLMTALTDKDSIAFSMLRLIAWLFSKRLVFILFTVFFLVGEYYAPPVPRGVFGYSYRHMMQDSQAVWIGILSAIAAALLSFLYYYITGAFKKSKEDK